VLNNTGQFIKTNALFLIILLGLVIRMSFFLSLQPWRSEVVEKTIIVADAVGYNDLALSLLSNHSFTAFDGFRTPVYPIFIALIYSISSNSVWLVFLVQIVLSLLSVFYLYKITLEIFSHKIALLSCFLFAINIHFALYAVTLLSETLFVFLFLISTYYFVRFIKENRITDLCISSVILAVSTLERPVSYLFPFVILFFLLIQRKNLLKQRFLYSFLYLLIFSITISPWLIRNYTTFGAAKLTTQAGINLLYCNVSATEAYKTKIPYETVRQNYTELFRKNGVDTITNPFKKAEIYSEYGQKYIKENFILYSKRHFMGIVNMYSALATKHIASVFHLKNSSLTVAQIEGPNIFKRISAFFGSKTLSEIIIALVLSLYLIVSYVFAFYTILLLVKKPDYFIFLFLCIIIYFSLVTGVIGDARLRMPLMPFINILCAVGIFTFYEKRKIKKALN
jgi:4-amino-4-deoxy-L-arabinose transferase-like glycosyltransferase